MVPMIESPPWLLIIVLAIVFVVAISSRQRKRLERRRFEVRICRQCGTSQPSHAEFCRQCGTRLLD
jgi:ribosomal protein L40E